MIEFMYIFFPWMEPDYTYVNPFTMYGIIDWYRPVVYVHS